MKIAESWLRDWVDPDLDAEGLAQRLTMLGLEVDAMYAEGGNLDDIVVGEVVAVDRHPDADRLTVCKVATGKRKPAVVVCGAPNVEEGMKSPFARPGTTLPNGITLEKAKIRGVESNGMLCSAVELGLGEESDGIIALPGDAPLGASLADYLSLPDTIFDLDLTPNRGDCFSVLGVARDLAALTGAELRAADFEPVEATTEDTIAVELPEPAGCPVFAGQLIRGIDASARSPLWLVERLRRVGLREIHPVVDVTNYVMMDLGQPLHAYDADLVKGAIRPRLARQGERVTLLDESEVEVNGDTLVITDDSGVIGLAGIMGGLSTMVSGQTTNVFLEAAFWPQAYMAGRARSYGMHTDASMRFERGVDPTGQRRAVNRATQLLLEIAGGQAGPLVLTKADKFVPKARTIPMRRSRLATLLGADIPDVTISGILEGLGLDVEATTDGWNVTVPLYRFDLAIEADLIEEIARIYGYDAIPEITAITATPLETVTETRIELDSAANVLVARDYQEVVTYSFVAASSDKLISGCDSQLELSNPISSEMSIMRSSLWPGMLEAAAANAARQQERIRLFEIGKSFHGSLKQHDEVVRIAAIASGSALPEQWGTSAQAVDFFDIKADIAALLQLAGDRDDFEFTAAAHPALQPGQCAEIRRNGETIGVVGQLHPRIVKSFDLKRGTFAFELDAEKTLASAPPVAKKVSRYPAIRRDIAVIVNDKVLADDLVDAVASAAPELIQDVRIFDVYKGPGIEAGLKSVAIGLILQETSRTLTDDDADAAQAAAVQKLQQQFAAELRD